MPKTEKTGETDDTRDGDTLSDAPAVGSVPEADTDTDGDTDGERDGSNEPDADATAPNVALPVTRAEGDTSKDALGDTVTRAEGDTSKDALGDRLVPALSDNCGLGDTDMDRDTVGEHDATGSTNGAPTAEPTPTAHAFVLNSPPESTPSNTTARCASNTRNEAAGSVPMPLPHPHPLEDDAPLPGDCTHVA